MPVSVISSASDWAFGVAPAEAREFVQTYGYALCLARAKRPFVLLRIESHGSQKSVLALTQKLPLGIRYAFFPRVRLAQHEVDELVHWGREHDYTFLRFELAESVLVSPIRTQKVSHRFPPCTLLLDLHKTEEELLKNMHAKTRYNIQLAKKKGVVVKEEKNAALFALLDSVTTTRNKFSAFDRLYYEALLSWSDVTQLTAYHADMPLASIILVHSGRRTVYFLGASANEKRELMAPYILQWEAILCAKKYGSHEYDLWGIAPAEKREPRDGDMSFHGFSWPQNHHLSGVTRFKVGFGGNVYQYPDAFDGILKPMAYTCYKIAHSIL